MYYYTTSGAYRRAKMIIDYINIVLSVTVAVFAIMILFFRSNSGILFPLVFLAGGTVNLLTGIKKLMNQNKLGGWVLIGVAALIYLMAVLTLVLVF